MKNTNKIFVSLMFIMSINISLLTAKTIGDESIEGRWDMTITKGDKKLPSWLEVNHSGIRTLTGHFVGDGGSARPVSKINFKDGKLSFRIPPQWDDSDQDLQVEGTLENGKLSGTMLTPKGENLTWTAKRAPKLWREKEPVWDKPISLFNGKDLTGWETMENKNNQWVVADGILKSPRSGANIRTKNTYNDFKLHVEFRYPKDSNSGVYLRGRYEVQVSDSKGMPPLKDYLGAIYGFIAPLEMVAKEPGEWQSFDITLVGRLVTLVGNGKQIIYKQEIPGITGGAMDSNEAEPGPIMIQGDHGPVEYRNIILTPAK
jgi:hypothetical protein